MYVFAEHYFRPSTSSDSSLLQHIPSLSTSSPMTAALPAPSRAEILSLLRSLLRVAGKFTDYNIREYTKRRTIDGFRANKGLSDPSTIATAYADGKSQLEVARRQAVVYSLYAPKVKSIMEAEKK